MVLPEEEKGVIRGIVRGVRVLKLSQSPEVARAAAKWDRTITCLIKWKLMSGVKSTRRNVANKINASVDSLAPARSALRASASGEFLSRHPVPLKSSRASLRSPRDVSQGRD